MTTQSPNVSKPSAVLLTGEGKSVRTALWGFLFLHGLAAGITVWFLVHTTIVIFWGLAALVVWSVLITALHFYQAVREANPPAVAAPLGRARTFLGQFAEFGQYLKSNFEACPIWSLYLLGAVPITMFLWPFVHILREPSVVPPGDLRLASFIFLGIASVLYLYGNYIQVFQNRLQTALLPPILRLSKMVLAAYAITAGILFVFLSTGYDVCWLGWCLIGLATVLGVEPLLLEAMRFYRPVQKGPDPIGASLILEFVFGSRQGVSTLVHDFEELVGAKIGEFWILGFLRETIEIVLVIGLLLGWLSTGLRSVPLANEGVLITFGHYEDQTLKPGLHLLLPWPMQELRLVETKRLRDVSLGFDKDLSGPLLWTAKHVEGEQNLLVDGGESLLTVNVPIMYRVSQPVTFLKNTIDVESALRYLAERKMTQIVGARESFHIMTEDRAAIAQGLKEGLQSEVNRLGLGVEIVFVGLEDIHPPVDVAPAYENVISAQEQKEALIDDALAYEARTLPDAKSQAHSLIVAANAAYTNRLDMATGGGTRFTLILPSSHAYPDLLRLRLEYDVLDKVLPAPSKTIMGTASASDCYLDLRDIKSTP